MLPCPVCSGSKKSGHRNKFAQVNSVFKTAFCFMFYPLISTINVLLWFKKEKKRETKITCCFHFFRKNIVLGEKFDKKSYAKDTNIYRKMFLNVNIFVNVKVVFIFEKAFLLHFFQSLLNDKYCFCKSWQ
jgi:hypothetical protein